MLVPNGYPYTLPENRRRLASRKSPGVAGSVPVEEEDTPEPIAHDTPFASDVPLDDQAAAETVADA